MTVCSCVHGLFSCVCYCVVVSIGKSYRMGYVMMFAQFVCHFSFLSDLYQVRWQPAPSPDHGARFSKNLMTNLRKTY